MEHPLKLANLENGAGALLSALAPDAGALMDWLRPRIDESMLVEIAEADYGMDFDEHLAALRPIRDANAVLAPMGWEPKEVLELMRWCEPDDPTWKPGAVGERGHLMRAFCCGALLRSAAEPANYGYFSGENQTIIQLIASVLVLGDEATDAALRFLSWRALTVHLDDDERPFFALGVLLLAAAQWRAEEDADLLQQLCWWVIAEEQTMRVHLAPVLSPTSDSWLLGLTWFGARDATWRAVAWSVLVELPHSPVAEPALYDIAARLVTNMPDTPGS